MDAKSFIMISLWVFISFFTLTSGAEGGIDEAMPCVKKLLPCKDYLSNPASPPPTCCYPLKQMLSDETACLCGVLNNQVFMKQFNITKEDVLKLPAACGAKADISVCKKEAAVGPSAQTPSASTPDPTKDSSSADRMFNGFIVLVSMGLVSMSLTLAAI